MPLEMMEASLYQIGWWYIKLWITQGGLKSEPYETGELGYAAINFSKLSWIFINRLLWLSAAVVGLKINEDDLIY